VTNIYSSLHDSDEYASLDEFRRDDASADSDRPSSSTRSSSSVPHAAPRTRSSYGSNASASRSGNINLYSSCTQEPLLVNLKGVQKHKRHNGTKSSTSSSSTSSFNEEREGRQSAPEDYGFNLLTSSSLSRVLSLSSPLSTVEAPPLFVLDPKHNNPSSTLNAHSNQK